VTPAVTSDGPADFPQTFGALLRESARRADGNGSEHTPDDDPGLPCAAACEPTVHIFAVEKVHSIFGLRHQNPSIFSQVV